MIMKKIQNTKTQRKLAKKKALCEKCKGTGIYQMPSSISPGRTFGVICTYCA